MTASATEYRLKVSGMTCAACATRIERVLRRLPGVSTADVNLASEEAVVTGSATVTRSGIQQAVEKAGWKLGDLDLVAVELELHGEVSSANQLKDEPQPQVFCALGLLISNPDFSRLSL